MYLASLYTFSSLLPLVAALFVCTLGFFVWLKNTRSSISILFFLYCLVISTWLFGTFKLFNADTDASAIFWDRFIYLGVVFIPIFLYHFGLMYGGIRTQKTVLWVGYALCAFFLTVSQTDLFVQDLFVYAWGVHTRAQVLHHPFLVYFFFYFILFFINLYRQYQHSTGQQKTQARYLLIGFFILDAIGPLAFLPAYGTSVYPIIFLSAIPFVLLVAYAMVKYQALNVKILSVEIFSALVTLLFLAEFFLSLTWAELLLRFAALVLVVLFVILLLRSVYSEVSKREKIERLNGELQQASKRIKHKHAQLQKSHQREMEKTQEVLKLKDEFVFIAAHELKAPVFAINGFVQLVEGEMSRIPKIVREYLGNIQEASEHLGKLVNDLLQVAREGAGTMKVEVVAVDLLPILNQVVHEQDVLAKERQISFKVHVPERAQVLADAAKLTEVLTNLVSNAIKYNRDGGSITIDVTAKPRELVVSVADTGYGIPQEQQSKIFGKFFRASGKATQGVVGTGLGLFITKMLVEKMGGNIKFLSVVERGTTFTLTLPRPSAG